MNNCYYYYYYYYGIWPCNMELGLVISFYGGTYIIFTGGGRGGRGGPWPPLGFEKTPPPPWIFFEK